MIIGIPVATTSEASDAPFSSEKKLTAYDTTSRRTIISTNATGTIATDRPSEVCGRKRLRMSSEPTAKNPNPASANASSVADATPSAPGDFDLGVPQQPGDPLGGHDHRQPGHQQRLHGVQAHLRSGQRGSQHRELGQQQQHGHRVRGALEGARYGARHGQEQHQPPPR
jgi:hypothetical protein